MNKLFISNIRALSSFAFFLFISANVNSTSIEDIYVLSKNPFLAEIPLCSPELPAKDYAIKIASNEEINSSGEQPVTESIDFEVAFLDDTQGVITISSIDALPDGTSFFINLVNTSNRTLASRVYRDLILVDSPPDNLGCASHQQKKVEVAKTGSSSKTLIIETIKLDTWLNIAEMVNIAWYNEQYPVEQVIGALYKGNINSDSSFDSSTPLPSKMKVPDSKFIDSIEKSEYSNIDETHKDLVVDNKNAKLSSRIKDLYKSMSNLKEEAKNNSTKGDNDTNLKKILTEIREEISALESLIDN